MVESDLKEILRTIKIFGFGFGLLVLSIATTSLFFQCLADSLFGKKKEKKKQRNLDFFD